MRKIVDPDLDRLREQVRDWLADNVPKEKRPRDGEAMRAYDQAWQRQQYDGGWAGIAWPEDYGGRGLSLLEQMVWYEECARAKAPPIGSSFIGLSHAGPTIITRGDEAQKRVHLPLILRGDAVWCQGFSEPSAGSDLASLRTRADVVGDQLIVNGSKIWTTYGPVADYQELLVRTDPESSRGAGVSWVICDMHSPGITIRPIKAMSGTTHFCQVFYDDVAIPLANVVGELNAGWSVAMTTLGFERGTGTVTHQMELSEKVEALIELAGALPAPDGRRRAIDDDMIAAELATLRAEAAALRSMTMLTVSRGLREAVPGAEGNIVALYFAEFSRRLHTTALELLGPAAEWTPGGHDWVTDYLECFRWGIGGGTVEIRRNAIGERLLHLPKTGVKR